MRKSMPITPRSILPGTTGTCPVLARRLKKGALAMEMIDILKAVVQKGASDLHLVIGQPPMIRVNGELKPLAEFGALSAEESRRLVFTLLSDDQRARFEKDWELDFSV